MSTVAQNRAFQTQIRNPDATNFGLRKSGKLNRSFGL